MLTIFRKEKGDRLLLFYSSADKTTQKQRNQTIGVRTGNGSIASVNGGVGVSNGRSFDTQTLLTSLTGDTVNVTTTANTSLSSAMIAAVDKQGHDTGKLTLATNTLTTENLTDIHYNTQSGLSIAANVGLTPATKDPKPDAKNTENPSSTKLNSEHLALKTSTTTSGGKTLATLGEGTLILGDPQTSTDTTTLNRDVTKVNQELYSSSTGTKVDATLDNRLLSQTGQKEIVDDVKVASKITDTIQKIATLDDVGLSDFFSQTEKSVKLFTAQNEVLKNNPDLAEKLSNPNLSPDEKRSYQLELVHAMENQLGYKLIDDIKVISTDEKGQGGKDVKGFITTLNDTIYSNDKNQNSTVDTIKTLGQEIAGTMQKREGVDITTNREQHNDYQNAIAEDIVNDVAFTLKNNDYKPMAETNNHVPPKSFEEYSQLQQNNAEFAGLDKELGDNLVSGVYSKKSNTLTITDNDTRKNVTVKVKSGSLLGDSIYNGTYEILDFANSTKKFRLDAIDSSPRDDINQNASDSNEFRLHQWGSGLNLGCISVTECNGAASGPNWNSVYNIISNTKKTTVIDQVNPYKKAEYFWEKIILPNKPSGKPITKYGTLKVVE